MRDKGRRNNSYKAGINMSQLYALSENAGPRARLRHVAPVKWPRACSGLSPQPEQQVGRRCGAGGHGGVVT